MKFILKRPKIIIKKNPEVPSYLIIYIFKKLNKSKKKYGLLELKISSITSSSRNFFINNNILPFYRRNNIILGIIEEIDKTKFNGKTYLLLIPKDKDIKTYSFSSYLNMIENDFISIKMKNLLKLQSPFSNSL